MAALDVTGLSEDKVKCLEKLIESWRQGSKPIPPVEPVRKRKVHPSEFLVKRSHVIGGKVTRAMAYEEE